MNNTPAFLMPVKISGDETDLRFSGLPLSRLKTRPIPIGFSLWSKIFQTTRGFTP